MSGASISRSSAASRLRSPRTRARRPRRDSAAAVAPGRPRSRRATLARSPTSWKSTSDVGRAAASRSTWTARLSDGDVGDQARRRGRGRRRPVAGQPPAERGAARAAADRPPRRPAAASAPKRRVQPRPGRARGGAARSDAAGSAAPVRPRPRARRRACALAQPGERRAELLGLDRPGLWRPAGEAEPAISGARPRRQRRGRPGRGGGGRWRRAAAPGARSGRWRRAGSELAQLATDQLDRLVGASERRRWASTSSWADGELALELGDPRVRPLAASPHHAGLDPEQRSGRPARSTGRGATAGGGCARADPVQLELAPAELRAGAVRGRSKRARSARHARPARRSASARGRVRPRRPDAPASSTARRIRPSSRSSSATRSWRTLRSCWAARVRRASSCSSSARSARSAWTCCSAPRSRRSRSAISSRSRSDWVRACASSSSRSLDLGGQLGGATARALGGQLGAPGAPLLEHVRARPLGPRLGARHLRAPGRDRHLPDRERHHDAPELEECPAGQRPARARPAPRSSSATSPGPRRSATAARAWRGTAGGPASVSTTSMAWPRSSGRRRRQRPVTRTVTVRPPSATHSTASIPTSEEGRSVIAARR